MSIQKRFFKTKDTCKVSFKLTREFAKDAKTIHLVGDFNKWNEKKTPLKKLRDGSFSAHLELKKDKQYQFRYLIDQQRWENDNAADKYVPSPFSDAENSVVIT